MAKENNPFKMSGSWFGFVVGITILWFITLSFELDVRSRFIYKLATEPMYFFEWVGIFALIGFLVGWGIQSSIGEEIEYDEYENK